VRALLWRLFAWWTWLSQPLWWREQQVRALLSSLFASWAWAQLATVLADTTGDGAVLPSVRLVGLVPARFCRFAHDK
jgi:hypothetical protein